MLADPGAVADLTASLAEGLRGHIAAAQARMPNAALSVQLDEPSLPAALAGRVNTESGLDFYRRVPVEVARDRLREVAEAIGVPLVVHCCAPDVPVKLLREAGAQALSIDLTLVDLDDVPKVDALGEYLDGGGRLVAGVVPPLGQPQPGVDKAAADRVQGLWHRLGFAPEQLPRQVGIATTCGMAGASPEYARFAMEASREAAKRLHG
nr:hypothetical protein [Glycomyces amatae]